VTRSGAFIVVLVAAQLGCSAPEPPASPPHREQPSTPAFVGKIWLSTDNDAPPGTFRLFTPAGLLLMDSCGETYRIAQWRAIDDSRIEWTEDSARIEARIVRVTESELQMQLQLVNSVKDESYRAADTAGVCPDMPR
jgi:hypothetical protein